MLAGAMLGESQEVQAIPVARPAVGGVLCQSNQNLGVAVRIVAQGAGAKDIPSELHPKGSAKQRFHLVADLPIPVQVAEENAQ